MAAACAHVQRLTLRRLLAYPAEVFKAPASSTRLSQLTLHAVQMQQCSAVQCPLVCNRLPDLQELSAHSVDAVIL
jgi:hypothetical protein